MGTINARLVTAIVALSMLAAGPHRAAAAPGEIADTPLFLSSVVQPNIFFAVDDSGSMDWEVLLTAGARSEHDTAPNSGNLDFSPNSYTEDREHCVGYNAMAYDPNLEYEPWAGVDTNSNDYVDQALGTALVDPFNPGTGTRNLTRADGTNFAAGYGIWTDTDNDGVYDDGECPIGPDPDLGSGYSTRAPGFTDPRWVFVDTLSAADQANYANWYSYFRKRELVTKKALSELIVRSTERMGLGTLHNNNTVGTPIADVDDISTPVNATARNNKNELMRQLFRINSDGGTPLRETLEEVGEYFAGGDPGGLFGGDTPDDPILSLSEGGSCQQNFTVLLSDGFWNGDDPSVGNADGDGNSEWDGGAFADTDSNTLADVAMHYYETDLDTGLPADVKPTVRDENTQQHMNTYTVAFGVNGTLDAGPVEGALTFDWPTPVEDETTTIDDLRHAAYNGRGQFLSAGNPQELINSLVGAISDISDLSGTAAAVSFNSTVIDTGSLVFRASFNSEGWYGDLEAIRLQEVEDAGNPGSSQLEQNSQWLAGDILASRDLDSNPRDIVTFNGTRGIPFEFPDDYTDVDTDEINDAQVLDILANAPFAADTTDADEITANQKYGEDLVAFLRGDHSNEAPNGQGFRDRGKRRLGDIISSSPAFVGAPNTAYPDNLEATSYSSFVNAWRNRAPRIYVGANDGMLHAFDVNGDEQFAYVPGAVYSAASGEGLHSLAEPNYNHRYFVDLSPKTADVYIGGAWKTVLLGGLRAGGQGIFALDITNPAGLTEGNAASKVLWEYTDADLGYTFSDIQVGRLANGRWAAIFGNGYNDSGDGQAKLYIKYLDDPDAVKILDTNVGTSNGDCSDPGNDCNGMSTPALADLNGDGIIDRIYAGDLHGNLWVVDVNDADDSNWDFAFSDGTNPRPLFQACSGATCTAGNRQPITSKPELARHPQQSMITTSPNLLVFFGTGQYLTSPDNSSAAQQTFYGVWDGGWSGTTSLTRADLEYQTLAIEAGTGFRRVTTSRPVIYAYEGTETNYGWYLDLNDVSTSGAAERVVADPVVIGDILFFNSLVPSSTACGGGGSGWLMAVDMLTGTEPSFAVVDLNNDGDFENDAVIAGLASDDGGVNSEFIRGTGKGGDTYRFSPEVDRVQASENQSENRTSWTILDY